MHRASRRVARCVPRALDAFARPHTCVDVSLASFARTAHPSTCPDAARTVVTTSGAHTSFARSFASSGTPPRANDAHGERSNAYLRDARVNLGETSEKTRDKTEKGGTAGHSVEAFTPTTTTFNESHIINFRCLPKNKHLKDEVYGRTLRERWESTYPNAAALKTFPGLYHLRLKVLSMYIRLCGGWPFAVFSVSMLFASWVVSSYVVALGMVGWVLMMKGVGLGDYGFQALQTLLEFYKGVTGGEARHLPLILGAALAYRMTYYTLPLTYFMFEELRFVLRRVVRLMRWVV